MDINNSYYDSDGNTGTSQVSHGGTCYDPYSHGKSLSDADVLVSSPFTFLLLILLKELGHAVCVFGITSCDRTCACGPQPM